jgi:hypothetical protein
MFEMDITSPLAHLQRSTLKSHLLYATFHPMKLLTKALLKQFEMIGDQSESEDPILVCKFFYPDFHRTRYASEYDPEHQLFFGYVDGDFPERGTFSLQELLQNRGKF